MGDNADAELIVGAPEHLHRTAIGAKGVAKDVGRQPKEADRLAHDIVTAVGEP